MNKKPTLIAAALASALSATDAGAAPFAAVLTSFTTYSGGGSTAGNISSSTASWSYDHATGLLSQTGGTFDVRFSIAPTTTLFRHSITGLVLSNGGNASAASYVCSEGNFGANVGASLCGNYNFGANFLDESTVSWGPGTSTTRVIGGDDVAFGPQRSLSAFNTTQFVSWTGTTLVLSNASCNPFAPGNANGCATSGGSNTGYTWTFAAGPCYLDNGEILEPCVLPPPLATVPVPAAAWLFGGALVALGSARRRRTGTPERHR